MGRQMYGIKSLEECNNYVYKYCFLYINHRKHDDHCETKVQNNFPVRGTETISKQKTMHSVWYKPGVPVLVNIFHWQSRTWTSPPPSPNTHTYPRNQWRHVLRTSVWCVLSLTSSAPCHPFPSEAIRSEICRYKSIPAQWAHHFCRMPSQTTWTVSTAIGRCYHGNT